MIKCIVVDDEPLAIGLLAKHIQRYGQLELVKKCPNALEAFDILHQQPIDLLFLDIKMPVISGLDFLRSLKDPPKVIFTTAFSEHALEGFELDAVDYLLKPITYERFEKSMQKLSRLFPQEQQEERSYTYFKVSGKLVKIAHADLFCAQSVKDYIHLKTANGNFLTHMTMKQLASFLPNPPFVRVHRSYIINRDHVTVIGRNQLDINGQKVPIGEYYRSNLHKGEH